MVDTLTSRRGDARVTMSIVLSGANNTLTGFRYETVLTTDAALTHSILLAADHTQCNSAAVRLRACFKPIIS